MQLVIHKELPGNTYHIKYIVMRREVLEMDYSIERLFFCPLFSLTVCSWPLK